MHCQGKAEMWGQWVPGVFNDTPMIFGFVFDAETQVTHWFLQSQQPFSNSSWFKDIDELQAEIFFSFGRNSRDVVAFCGQTGKPSCVRLTGLSKLFLDCNVPKSAKIWVAISFKWLNQSLFSMLTNQSINKTCSSHQSSTCLLILRKLLVETVFFKWKKQESWRPRAKQQLTWHAQNQAAMPSHPYPKCVNLNDMPLCGDPFERSGWLWFFRFPKCNFGHFLSLVDNSKRWDGVPGSLFEGAKFFSVPHEVQVRSPDSLLIPVGSQRCLWRSIHQDFFVKMRIFLDFSKHMKTWPQTAFCKCLWPPRYGHYGHWVIPHWKPNAE